MRLSPSLTARLVGLGIGCSVVVAGCGGDSDSSPPSSKEPTARAVLPDGGRAPAQRITDLPRAAAAADCQLRESSVNSRDHTADIAEPVRYPTDPPTSGPHFQVPAEDGAYSEAPADTAVVHAFEHGRVGIWFNPRLAERRRAALKAVFEEDSYQLLVVPRSGMPQDVVATAWNREPDPEGRGRLLVCPRLTDASFDALRAFRDEHRGRGPEPIP